MTTATVGKGLIYAGLAGVAGYLGWRMLLQRSHLTGESPTRDHNDAGYPRAKRNGTRRRQAKPAASTV